MTPNTFRGKAAAAVLTTVVLCLSLPALAQEKPEWFFHDIVDIAFVKEHVQIPMAQDVMIIDSRPKRTKYDPGHIPMAVSIPDSEFEKLTHLLPANKAALLIFYCEGTTCKLSHNSAAKAEGLGYTNVKVFAEGFPRWIQEPGHYAAVSGEWIKKQMDDGTLMTLVDSRPKRAKYDQGHIPEAMSLPDTEFDKLSGKLPADKNIPLVFYCGGLDCRLSHKSAEKAMALGYTQVAVYAAGYPDWQAKFGQAVAKPAAEESGAATAQAPARTLKAGKQEGSIDPAEFERIVKEDPAGFHLVDVRDADEFAKGSLKGAVNIPVDKLEAEIPKLPSDKPVVFICGTGARSGESFYMVQDLRPQLKEVYYVDSQMTFTKEGGYKLVQPQPKAQAN